MENTPECCGLPVGIFGAWNRKHLLKSPEELEQRGCQQSLCQLWYLLVFCASNPGDSHWQNSIKKKKLKWNHQGILEPNLWSQVFILIFCICWKKKHFMRAASFNHMHKNFRVQALPWQLMILHCTYISRASDCHVFPFKRTDGHV